MHNHLNSIDSRTTFFAKYVFVGITTPMIYLALYWLLEAKAELLDWIASSTGYTIAVVYQFYMHSKLTFSVAPSAQTFAKFLITIGLGAALSYIFTTFLPYWFENSNVITAILILIITPILNYLLFSKWVFNRSHH